MVFASPVFLFLFLPATLAFYFLAPRPARNAMLLLSSALFCLWGEGRYLALLAASVIGNWGFGLALARTADAQMR